MKDKEEYLSQLLCLNHENRTQLQRNHTVERSNVCIVIQYFGFVDFSGLQLYEANKPFSYDKQKRKIGYLTTFFKSKPNKDTQFTLNTSLSITDLWKCNNDYNAYHNSIEYNALSKCGYQCNLFTWLL